MASLENNIWFCAFYEGEGCVCNDITNNNRLRVSISQNDVAPLELGKSIWGGFIRHRVRQSKNKICHGNDWVLNHNQAIKFLEDIKPYMKIPYKIQQLQNAMDVWQKGWSGQYKCSFCDLVYSSPQGRRRHEKKVHTGENTVFTCHLCDNKYEYKDSLTRHLKSHT
jgi:rubredoxin